MNILSNSVGYLFVVDGFLCCAKALKLGEASFTIVKIWKQPRCPLVDEWIRKMWCIYTMEYYSHKKLSKIFPFMITWMDLQSIRLSEISQIEKDKYCKSPPIYGIQKTK